MAFEKTRHVSTAVVVLDAICDLINIADMISTFFIPITNVEGKKIFTSL
jgi:hypothetical protein